MKDDSAGTDDAHQEPHDDLLTPLTCESCGRDILESPKSRERPKGPLRCERCRSRYARQNVYAALILCCYLIAAVFVVLAFTTELSEKLCYGVAFSLAFVASLARVFLTRSEAPDARQVLKHDKRKPILYLRTFRTDTSESRFFLIQSVAFALARVAGAESAPAASSREIELTAALGKIGPCIALAPPTSILPAIGAARMWVREPEWRNTVKHFIERSQFTLLRAGSTANLAWELEQAIECDPAKLLIWVPGRAKSYREFARWADEILPVPLPEEAHEFIMFESDGTPRGLGRSEHFTYEREKAILWTLKPFLDRIGYTPSQEQAPAKSAWGTLLFTVGLAIVGAMVLLAVFTPPPCEVKPALVGRWNFAVAPPDRYSIVLRADGSFSIRGVRRLRYLDLNKDLDVFVADGRWCQVKKEIRFENVRWYLSRSPTPLSEYRRSDHMSMSILSQTGGSLELETANEGVISLRRSDLN